MAAKAEWFEFDELEALLLAHESRLAHNTEASSVAATLNLTHTSQTSQVPSNDSVQQDSSSTQPQANFTNQRGNFRGGKTGGRNNRGGRSGRGGRSNVQCQVCSKFGHDASVCYHRYSAPVMPTLPMPAFNNSYQYLRPGYTPPSTPTANATFWPAPTTMNAPLWPAPTANITTWPPAVNPMIPSVNFLTEF